TQHYLPFLGAAAKGNNLSRVRAVEYEGKKGHFSPTQDLYLQGLELGEAAIGLIAEGDGLDRLVVSKIANDTHMEAGGGVEGQTKRVVPRKIILPKGTLEFPDLDDF